MSLDQSLLHCKWDLIIFLASEAGDILILEDGDNILMEQYFEPSHSISLDKLQTLSSGGTGRTITITGNSDVITSDEGLNR